MTPDHKQAFEVSVYNLLEAYARVGGWGEAKLVMRWALNHQPLSRDEERLVVSLYQEFSAALATLGVTREEVAKAL